MIKDYLYFVETHAKGRGIFTRQKIPLNTIIEESPVIVMPAGERTYLDKTLLHDYIFEWGNDKKKCALALGLVSLYNHSYKSNCEYFMDFKKKLIRVETIRNIEAEEELTINYNGDWNSEKQVWFTTK